MAQLDFGQYLARPALRASAGAFAFGLWSDDGSEEKGPHTHADAHFMLIASGRYATMARGPDDGGKDLLIFNPAGTCHRDQFLDGGAFFTITVGEKFWSGADVRRAPPTPVQISDRSARVLVRRALRELANWSADSGFICESLCTELLGLFDHQGEDHRPPTWFIRAQDCLREPGTQVVQLGALCHEIGVHPVHLTRTFRRYLRCTPGEYLRASRLSRAARMLTEGNTPLAEIASRTGFADQSHLNRHFKRAYGIPPGTYRQLTRSN